MGNSEGSHAATQEPSGRSAHGGTGPVGSKAIGVTGSAWLGRRTRRAPARGPVRDRAAAGRRVAEWIGTVGGGVADGVLYTIARHYVSAGAVVFGVSIVAPRPFGVWGTLALGVLYCVAIGYGLARVRWARVDGRRSDSADGRNGAHGGVRPDGDGSAAAAPVDPLAGLMWADDDVFEEADVEAFESASALDCNCSRCQAIRVTESSR